MLGDEGVMEPLLARRVSCCLIWPQDGTGGAARKAAAHLSQAAGGAAGVGEGDAQLLPLVFVLLDSFLSYVCFLLSFCLFFPFIFFFSSLFFTFFFVVVSVIIIIFYSCSCSSFILRFLLLVLVLFSYSSLSSSSSSSQWFGFVV